MTLKDLINVLPGYVVLNVHDHCGKFAYRWTRDEFSLGFHSKLNLAIVHEIIPLAPYMLEVTVEEANTDDQG